METDPMDENQKNENQMDEEIWKDLAEKRVHFLSNIRENLQKIRKLNFNFPEKIDLLLHPQANDNIGNVYRDMSTWTPFGNILTPSGSIFIGFLNNKYSIVICSKNLVNEFFSAIKFGNSYEIKSLSGSEEFRKEIQERINDLNEKEPLSEIPKIFLEFNLRMEGIQKQSNFLNNLMNHERLFSYPDDFKYNVCLNVKTFEPKQIELEFEKINVYSWMSHNDKRFWGFSGILFTENEEEHEFDESSFVIRFLNQTSGKEGDYILSKYTRNLEDYEGKSLGDKISNFISGYEKYLYGS